MYTSRSKENNIYIHVLLHPESKIFFSINCINKKRNIFNLQQNKRKRN